MAAESDFLRRVEQYYSGKLRMHGATWQGVDWNSMESQHLRFEQLLKVCEPGEPFSINDYGCGYGALIDYMASRDLRFTYRGLDISEAMLEQAREIHGQRQGCEFVSAEESVATADYSVASGIFNVKLDVTRAAWESYAVNTLHKLDCWSAKGFAFNALTSYSDPERMREDLYYGDPCFFFDYCKRNFSRNVALLHDYGLYEWTMLVRK
ncbi:MAG TPA: class I SAM-dependent methyltransferase [Bryobacteraceae bacterium]|nr:class I SAM-dependent methyltransferase [Bryobacteraceae bacterium]